MSELFQILIFASTSCLLFLVPVVRMLSEAIDQCPSSDCYHVMLINAIYRFVIFTLIAIIKPRYLLSSVWSVVRYSVIINILAIGLYRIVKKFHEIHTILTRAESSKNHESQRHFHPKSVKPMAKLELHITVDKYESRTVAVIPYSPSGPSSTQIEINDIFLTSTAYDTDQGQLDIEIFRYHMITGELKWIGGIGIDFPDLQYVIKASLIFDKAIYCLFEVLHLDDDTLNLLVAEFPIVSESTLSNGRPAGSLKRQSAWNSWNWNSEYTIAIQNSDLYLLYDPDVNVPPSIEGIKLVLLKFPMVNGVGWNVAESELHIRCPYNIDLEFSHHISHYLCFHLDEGFVAIDLLHGSVQFVDYTDEARVPDIYPQYFNFVREVDGDTFEVYRHRVVPNNLQYWYVKSMYDNDESNMKSMCVECLVEKDLPRDLAEECHSSLPDYYSNLLTYKLIFVAFLWYSVFAFWTLWFQDDLRV